jgi:tetratricopeptide (TPR) repeat protein
MTMPEEAWEGIRAQLDLRPGLWLAWIFSPDPQVLADLRRRTDEHSRARALQTRHRVLASDDDVATAPEWLLGLGELVDTPVAAVWLTDRGDRDDQGWRDVWARTLVRLNEMVDVLREALPCGLLIGGQPWVMPMVRDLAPALWALRAVVTPVETVEQEGERGDWAEALTVELALADPAEPSPTMAELIETVSADPRPDRVAETLLARLPQLPADTDRAIAYALLTDIRLRQGDRVGARDMAARSLAFGVPLGLDLTFEVLAAMRSSVAVEKLVEICRALLARDGETHEMVGRLWANLVNAAEFATDPETRVLCLKEAMAAAIRLREEHGDSAEHLADAAETAALLAEALMAAERLDDAVVHAVLSVQLAQELGQPDGGRLVGANLRILGRIEMVRDHTENALAVYQDAYEFSYASYEQQIGVTAEELSVVCLELGTLRLRLGLLDEADDDLAYALRLARHWYDEHSDDVNAVSLLAATLAGSAEIHAARGRIEDAEHAATESVELTRRLSDRSSHQFGPTLVERMRGLADVTTAQDQAQSIRDEAHFLEHAGTVVPKPQRFADGCPLRGVEQGDDDLASLRSLSSTLDELEIIHICRDRTVHVESVTTARRLNAVFPDTPLALGTLWRALYHLAIPFIKDDPLTAIETLTEATEIAERLLALVGEQPDVLYALYTLYDRIGDVPVWSNGKVEVPFEIYVRTIEWHDRYEEATGPKD